MKRVRDLIFWTHLVCGVAAGAVILLMSVTGVLLTYQRQMTAWADTRGLDASSPVPGAVRLPADALLRAVADDLEGEPTAITWRADPDAPAEIACGRGCILFANAYTGEALGQGAQGMRSFFRTVTDLHRWLAAPEEDRALGRAITGAANLIFLFVVFSGFYLWWPRNWALPALRSVTLFGRGLRGKARDFNWHNVVGFWSAVPLAVIVFSGGVISYPWAGDLVYRAVGDTPPARGGGGGGGGGEQSAPALPAGVAALQARAEGRVEGWRSVTLTLPEGDAETVAFNIDRGTGGQPQHRARLELDARTGQTLAWEPFAAGSPGRQARSILRFAHTGEIWGLGGQTLAGLVSAGAVLLVWTGLGLSWRRFGAWRKRGSREVEARRPRRARAKVGGG